MRPVAKKVKLLLLFCMALFFVGCSMLPEKSAKAEEKELVIPEFQTAREQYSFAKMYEQAQIISGEASRRRVQMDKQIQCYQRVVTKFPSDRVHTPLARLEIGDCLVNQGETRRAAAMFQDVIADYGDIAYVKARALIAIARVHDREQRYQEAKDIYKQVMEEFQDSMDPNVRELVKKAQQAYVKVYEKPKSKSLLKR